MAVSLTDPRLFDARLLDPEVQAALAVMLAEGKRQALPNDPLRAWQPTLKQKPFIDSVLHPEISGYWENWFVGGNRIGKCLSPWTPVEMGSATRLPAEMIGERRFDVRSWDGVTRCASQASAVFLRSIEPALRLYLDTGDVFEATYRHRVLTRAGWISVGNLLSRPGDPRWTERGVNSEASYDRANHRYDRRLRLDADSARGGFPRGVDVPHNSLLTGYVDVTVPTPARIRACLAAFPLSSSDAPDLLAALFALWTSGASDTTYPPSRDGSRATLKPADGSSLALISQEAHEIRDPEWYGSNALYVLPWPILLVGGCRLIAYQKIGLRPIIDFSVDQTHCYW